MRWRASRLLAGPRPTRSAPDEDHGSGETLPRSYSCTNATGTSSWQTSTLCWFGSCEGTTRTSGLPETRGPSAASGRRRHACGASGSAAEASRGRSDGTSLCRFCDDTRFRLRESSIGCQLVQQARRPRSRMRQSRTSGSVGGAPRGAQNQAACNGRPGKAEPAAGNRVLRSTRTARSQVGGNNCFEA